MSTDFVDINLLPRPVRPALGGPAWRRLMLPGVGLTIFALLLLLGATLIKTRNDQELRQQRAELQVLSQDVQALAIVAAEADVLQEQVTTLAIQAQQLEAEAERVRRENPALTPFLRALVETLLPRMTLTGVVPGGPNRYIVRGEAGSSALVVDYANALQQREEVRAVTPQSIENLGSTDVPGAVRWTLVVER
jgi:hypothetical protein